MVANPTPESRHILHCFWKSQQISTSTMESQFSSCAVAIMIFQLIAGVLNVKTQKTSSKLSPASAHLRTHSPFKLGSIPLTAGTVVGTRKMRFLVGSVLDSTSFIISILSIHLAVVVSYIQHIISGRLVLVYRGSLFTDTRNCKNE